MRGVNLIPAGRQQARRAAAALRLWAASGAVVLSAVTAGCLLTAAATAGHDRVADELAAAQGRVESLQQSSNALRRDLVKMEAERRAALAATDQPDWSILLRIVAKNLDAESSLRDVQLTERPQAANPKPAAVSHQFETRLSGNSPSPAAASAYVLRLQQLGLFDDVTLLRTMRQPSGMVSFEILCTISDTAVATAGGRP